MANVEKLLRYVRDLCLLCRNFVNFSDLYVAGGPAIFQCGALYLDQRACFLCLTVEDAGRHAAMAGLSGAYLAYCDCARKGTGEKLGIVAVVSQGDDDNLMVGRNGVFYDRKGRDYDATITKIVASPISLRQAFWAPYKKLVRTIEEYIAKRAATADADIQTQLAAAATTAPAAGPPVKPLFDPSVIALLSLAIGSLAAGAATVLAFLGKVRWPCCPSCLAGVALVVSAPSLLLAFIKLRKRNLGPILDANGWAINAKAKINVPFGERLTAIAKLPGGASPQFRRPLRRETGSLAQIRGRRAVPHLDLLAVGLLRHTLPPDQELGNSARNAAGQLSDPIQTRRRRRPRHPQPTPRPNAPTNTMALKIPDALKANVPQSAWGKVLAATPVIMTVIATLLAGLASSEMTRAQYDRSLAAQEQNKASDEWGFFQAKRLRGAFQVNTLDLLQQITTVPPLDAKSLRTAAQNAGLAPEVKSTLSDMLDSAAGRQALGRLAGGQTAGPAARGGAQCRSQDRHRGHRVRPPGNGNCAAGRQGQTSSH